MLGKNLKVEIFGTLCDNCLYSGFILSSYYDKRSVYVITNSTPPDVLECTVIAVVSCENKAQTRFIVAPVDEIFYEPEIRTRLSMTSLNFDKMVCVYEKSCGAVVYHKTSQDDVKVLLVKNHNGKCWTFPKGHVEKNETEQQTAIREIKEETGLDVQIEPDFRQTSIYRPFGKIKKKVVFFLAKADESIVSMQQSEIDYYLWVTIPDALKMCSHENDVKILYEARKRLCV